MADEPASGWWRPRQVNLGDMLVPALALMLVIEGILPFLAPASWRQAFLHITRFSDGQIRFMGLASMLAGLLLLVLFV